MSPTIVYYVAVPRGSEEDAAQRYSADPAVYAAVVDRLSLGEVTTPDSAMPVGPTPPLELVLGIAMVAGAALLLGLRHARRPSSLT